MSMNKEADKLKKVHNRLDLLTAQLTRLKESLDGLVVALEEWQDASRTRAGGETSKDGQGWVDN